MKFCHSILLTTLLSVSCLHAQQSTIVYLSGTGIDDTRTWRFRCTDGMRAGRWGTIEVPCNWELQGYGSYQYGWAVNYEGAQPDHEEGFYATDFRVERSWEGQRIFLWFDGVMTDTEVSVNGQIVGPKHQGGFYRFGYDVSDYLHYGKKNQLEVHVWKNSSDQTVNKAERMADWWNFGGIYRPVWLEVAPARNISNLSVDARADGHVRAQVAFDRDLRGLMVDAVVTPLGSDEVVGEVSGASIHTSDHRQTETVTDCWLDFQCRDIRPWDVEHPNLYVMSVRLRDASGNVIHERRERVGFRTIDIRPKDGIYLNGVKLVVKGVNRHSFWPDGGRATSRALSLEDAMLIKQMNMNAVRSHYPADVHFLDVCDSLGILYIDELAGWQKEYSTKAGSRLIPEMVRRDVNHPCVFLWSNGNEGGWNVRLDDDFAVYDIQHRHVIHPWADFDGLDTHHYPAYLTGVARFNNGSNIFMPTEFMHAMYDQGGGAGLADFWHRWEESPLFAGGFIWAFCDEAPRRTDRGGMLDSDRNHAPDGIVGPRREKEGSFYAIREVWSPIRIHPVRITSSYDGSLYVTNKYLFSTLEGASLRYRMKKVQSPLLATDVAMADDAIIAEGRIALPAIERDETRRVRIPTAGLSDADILEVEAVDASGTTVCNWTFAAVTPAEYLDRACQTSSGGITPGDDTPTAQTTEKGTHVIAGGGLRVAFDAATGMIREIRKGERVVPFNNGPISVGMTSVYQPSNSGVRVERNSDGLTENAVYVARYLGGLDSIVWRIGTDGRLSMDAVFFNRSKGGKGFDQAFMDTSIRNLGLTFSYPEEQCSGMRWMGRGPYRVWKNRLPGTNLGLWYKEYNNTITGESYGNYVVPEFKGYHANLYWATIESTQSQFTVHSATENLYLRIFTPQEPEGRERATMPDFPEGDISFLVEIPAIQSFKPISQHGPQSQPGNVRIKTGDDGLRIRLLFEF